MLIDALVLILAVTKKYVHFHLMVQLLAGACRGGGVLVNIAFVWLLLVK